MPGDQRAWNCLGRNEESIAAVSVPISEASGPPSAPVGPQPETATRREERTAAIVVEDRGVVMPFRVRAVVGTARGSLWSADPHTRGKKHEANTTMWSGVARATGPRPAEHTHRRERISPGLSE